jgi:hypothetical protein
MAIVLVNIQHEKGMHATTFRRRKAEALTRARTEYNEFSLHSKPACNECLPKKSD